MAHIEEDKQNKRLMVVARNDFGRLDPICDETGNPVDLTGELVKMRSSRERSSFIARVVQSAGTMER